MRDECEKNSWSNCTPGLKEKAANQKKAPAPRLCQLRCLTFCFCFVCTSHTHNIRHLVMSPDNRSCERLWRRAKMAKMQKTYDPSKSGRFISQMNFCYELAMYTFLRYIWSCRYIDTSNRYHLYTWESVCTGKVFPCSWKYFARQKIWRNFILMRRYIPYVFFFLGGWSENLPNCEWQAAGIP